MITSTFQPTDADGGLVLATYLPGGPGELDDKRLGWDDLVRTGDGPIWIHLDRTRERAQQWLRVSSGLDELVFDSLLAEDTRPRFQTFGDGVLVILRGVNMNPGAEPDELISLRLWVEEKRIITLRQFRFQTLVELRERAQQGKAPATTGGLVAAIAMGLSLRLGPTANNLEGMVDEIESSLVDSDSDDPRVRSQLSAIRRQSITYRRYLVPQRDALLGLGMLQSPVFSKHDLAELRVAAENVNRVLDTLEEVRDRAAVTQEEIRARREAKMSQTLYVLTIVATIALPLGLITGLLGINVGGIPWAESEWGFALTCGLLVGLAIAEILLFRFMRWL